MSCLNLTNLFKLPVWSYYPRVYMEKRLNFTRKYMLLFDCLNQSGFKNDWLVVFGIFNLLCVFLLRQCVSTPFIIDMCAVRSFSIQYTICNHQSMIKYSAVDISCKYQLTMYRMYRYMASCSCVLKLNHQHWNNLGPFWFQDIVNYLNTDRINMKKLWNVSFNSIS